MNLTNLSRFTNKSTLRIRNSTITRFAEHLSNKVFLKYMSADKHFISCNNTESLCYQCIYSIHCFNFTTAFIKSKNCFINVSLQMLDRNRVINAHNALFQAVPNTFYGVCMSRTVNIFTRTVIYTTMLITELVQPVIRCKFISVNSCVFCNVFLKKIEKSICLSIINNSSNYTTGPA